ncbi:HAD family hydrolase [Mucilaginibacter sp. PAMB04274]|uniref:HAD family hydrolase n=1 Tax=Mucilaginibacter sp. PAMB04274 TaxID=3138568 RepID=UPI0031F6AF7F
MKQRFKAIIFDLDGTIADTLPLCIAAFKKSIEPLLGKAVSDAEIIATFGPSEEGTIRKLIPLQEKAGVRSYLEHYQELHHSCPAPFSGIKELLATLAHRNVKLAMVTGKGKHSTRISLQQFGLTAYFNVLETGSPDGPNKIKGIRSVLKHLNAHAEECLYVGDAPSDILYCKEIGIPIAAAAWASTADIATLQGLHPEWLFRSVSELHSWVLDSLSYQLPTWF